MLNARPKVFLYGVRIKKHNPPEQNVLEDCCLALELRLAGQLDA